MTDQISFRATLTLPSDELLLIERELSVPRSLAYKAWVTPKAIAQWWAGRRGTATDISADVRVGGRWRYAMRTHDGNDIAFHGEYLDVVPGERLVHTETLETAEMAGLVPPVVTVTFTDVGENQSKVALLMDTGSRELRDAFVTAMEGGVYIEAQMVMLEKAANSLI